MSELKISTFLKRPERPVRRTDDAVTRAQELRTEARVFGRLILGEEPPAVLMERYVKAHEFLLRCTHPSRDVAVVAFAREHPWLASCLDAAAALRVPDSLLRKKVMLMAAILETSRFGADRFLPRATSHGCASNKSPEVLPGGSLNESTGAAASSVESSGKRRGGPAGPARRLIAGLGLSLMAVSIGVVNGAQAAIGLPLLWLISRNVDP